MGFKTRSTTRWSATAGMNAGPMTPEIAGLQLALAALIISVVLTGVLAAFTIFGLVGLALIVLSLGLAFRRAGDACADGQGNCPTQGPRRIALRI